MTTTTDTARDQAKAQLDHIRELMQWLEHANDVENMRDKCTLFEGEECPADEIARGLGFGPQTGIGHDVDEATQAIHENALEVEVNYGWRSVGNTGEELPFTPEQFRILLCTGGPAVRITGELDENGQPESARLEYSDWGTPWTEAHVIDLTGEDDGSLLAYAQAFYFGS